MTAAAEARAGRGHAAPPAGAGPRVAVACSGLGRVRRGNETWARTVAEALHADGVRVTLFGGAPRLEAACPYVGVPNWPRDRHPLPGWPSWGRRYEIEQRTFAHFLRRHLRAGGFDLVHVADPSLALRLRRDFAGSGPVVMYKDGLLLGPAWCSRFAAVQVLAPYYLQQAEAEGFDTRGWRVIPHLVDGGRFAPAADRAALRRELLPALPPDAFVVLAVGDFSPESNKRLDWVLAEVARLPAAAGVHVVVAGQSSAREADAFRRRAAALLGDRVHVVANAAPERMPLWYRAADVFAHAALREPFGIVFLEAMASGLPVVAHTFPVSAWIVGDGGEAVDMTGPGRAAEVLARWQADPALRRAVGERARGRALDAFSAGRIVPLYREAYAAATVGR